MHSAFLSKRINLIRGVVLLLSFVTMMTSIGVIGLASRTLVKMEYVSYVIGSRELVTEAVLLLTMGIFAFTTTPLAYFSIITAHQTTIVIYTVATSFVCLLSIVSGWIGFHLKDEVNSGLIFNWMNHSLSNEYGNPKAIDLTLSLDEIQREYTCCGVTNEGNSAEWLTSHWFITYDKWPRPRVPKSCCATCQTVLSRLCNLLAINSSEESLLTNGQGMCRIAQDLCSEPTKTWANVEACQGRKSVPIPKQTYMHTQGCYKPVTNDLLYCLTSTFLASVVMFFLTFLGACVSFLFHEFLVQLQYYDYELPFPNSAISSV